MTRLAGDLHRAYVGLGSNVDDPLRQVRSALSALDRLPHTRVLRVSRLYRTAPVGYADQPDFINAVAELATALEPHALLRELQRLEREAGRVRTIRNGPRSLDLDLLMYDDCEAADAELVLPHPRMHERAFVLLPLGELAPELTLPARGRVAELLRGLDTGGATPLPEGA